MDLSGYNGILAIAGGISVVGGAWYTVLKILRELRKEKKHQEDKILEVAQEYDKEVKSKLERRIDLLEAEFKNLEANVNKDLNHVKEVQTNELRNLGDKIEELREEVKTHSMGILNLLTKLVDKN